jgi:peptide/nickel transport system permease protein
MRGKLANFFFILLGLIVLIFFLFQALPNASDNLVSDRTDPKTKAAIEQELGLNEPLPLQLLYYLNDLSPLSVYKQGSPKFPYLQGVFIRISAYQCWLKVPYLRTSFQTKQPVSQTLIDAFWGTMVLAIASMLFALIIGIPVGVLAAVKKGSYLDNALVWISAIGISVPSFFSAMIFSWLFGFVWASYTGLSMTGSFWELDDLGENTKIQWHNLLLPAISLGIRPLAVFVQLTRNTMVDVLDQDFVRTARAKGLSYASSVWKHAFPNALNPLVTSVGGWFSSLLAGSFFTEYIFQWKGLGKVTIEALQQSDFPVIMGGVLFTACVFFVLHLFTELLYVWIDPRIKYE